MRKISAGRGKPNRYDLTGKYGKGFTTKGEMFLFDLEDYDRIKGYHWYINDSGYAVANVKGEHNRKVRMHRLVMEPVPEGMEVDHIRNSPECRNRKLDNRKSNLRFVTHAENSYNKVRRADNKSGHPGVYWDKRDGRWIAKIRKNGKSKQKSFPSGCLKEACEWQEKTAKMIFGEYAYGGA